MGQNLNVLICAIIGQKKLDPPEGWGVYLSHFGSVLMCACIRCVAFVGKVEFLSVCFHDFLSSLANVFVCVFPLRPQFGSSMFLRNAASGI